MIARLLMLQFLANHESMSALGVHYPDKNRPGLFHFEQAKQ